MNITLIITLLQAAAGILSGVGIAPGVITAVTAITSAIPAILAAFQRGGDTTSGEVEAVLAGLQATLATLQHTGVVDAETAARITAITAAIDAAIAADRQAQQVVDPSQLTEIEPLS